MSKIEFATAWRRNDPERQADALAFWKTAVRLPAELAKERISELCSLAYVENEVVGISTVAFAEYSPLRSRFAFYRCAVAPEFRRRELAILLTRHTITTMEGWCLEHEPDTVQGVATVLQARELDSKALNPVWSEYYGNLNLVGFSAEGDQVRVAWFRHARLT